MRLQNLPGRWFLLWLFFLIHTIAYGQIAILQELLSIERSSPYLIGQAHIALLDFNPESQLSLAGERPYNVEGVTKLCLDARWGRQGFGMAAFDLQYFGFETWSHWYGSLGIARQITPSLHAATSLSLVAYGDPSRRMHYRANASLFFGLKVHKRLFLSSSLQNLFPASSPKSASGITRLSIRSYYFLTRGIAWLAGVAIQSNGRMESVAGLGLQKGKNTLSLIVSPVTGRYGLGLERQIIKALRMRIEAHVHPLLGVSTTASVHWKLSNSRSTE